MLNTVYAVWCEHEIVFQLFGSHVLKWFPLSCFMAFNNIRIQPIIENFATLMKEREIFVTYKSTLLHYFMLSVLGKQNTSSLRSKMKKFKKKTQTIGFFGPRASVMASARSVVSGNRKVFWNWNGHNPLYVIKCTCTYHLPCSWVI